MQFRNQRDMSLIEILADEYESLFYVNLNDDSMSIFKMDGRNYDRSRPEATAVSFSDYMELMVLSNIDDNDLEAVTEFVKIKNIKKNLETRTSIGIKFKTKDDDVKYYDLRISKNNVDNESVVVSFFDETSEVKEQINYENEIKKDDLIIEQLAKDYDFIYIVDGKDKKINVLNITPELKDILDNCVAEGTEVIYRFDAFYHSIVLKEDLPLFLENIKISNVDRYLKAGKGFRYYFRTLINGKEGYYQIKIIRSADNDKAMIVSLVDETEYFNEKTEKEMIKKEAEIASIISELSGDYEFIYTVNLNKDSVSDIKVNKAFSKYINSLDLGVDLDSSHSIRMKALVENFVLESDRKVFKERTDIEYLRSRCEAGKSIVLNFKGSMFNSEKHYRIRIAPLVEEKDVMVIGIRNIESEVLAEVARGTMMARALGYQETLINSSTGYLEINLSKNVLINITDRENGRNIAKFKEAFIGEQYSYDDFMNWWCENIVVEDKEAFRNENSTSYLLKEFAKGNSRITKEIKRINSAGETRTLKADYYIFEDKNAKEIMTLVLVNDITKEKQNLEIIEALASNYATVCYLDLLSDKIYLYSMNNRVNNVTASIFTKYPKYSDCLKGYVETSVFASDKYVVSSNGSIEAIKRKLKNNEKYVITYRSISTGKPHYCEMTFVKMGERNGVVSTVALGFADKDEEICRRFVNDELIKENRAILLVDLENNKYRLISQNYDARTELDNEGSYEEIFKKYVASVSEINIDTFMELATCDGVKKAFENTNSKEFVYLTKRLKRDGWRRCLMKVVERKYNVPTLMIFTFMAIDAERAERLELSMMIEEQKNQLERQQVQLEEALRNAKSASNAKTTFLNNMSHDIRTPMNAIMGYTGLAQSHIDNTSQVKDYLSKISQASAHLLDLINDVLDMSRIESGKINLELKEENLSKIIHGLRNIINSDIVNKNQEFYVELSDVQNEDIVCDKLRINQIFLNLISNAIKYTKEKGMIHLKVKELFDCDSSKVHYIFTVKDNGIGMSKEFIKTIYEPFTRANNTTVSGIQGTGLGMVITKSFVDLMNGNITISSEEGKGTEISVDLLFDKAKKNSEIDLSKLKGVKTLVIDDQINGCKNEVRMLESVGINASYAISGKDGLKMIEESISNSDPYELIIVDKFMPEMDGIETSKLIREIADYNPKLLLMSYEETSIEKVTKEIGIDSIILKPIFPSDLYFALNNIYGSKKEVKNKQKKAGIDGKKILVVEDNELNTEISVEILENAGAKVFTANDGTVAVEFVKKSKPGDIDLILMDIQMPIMDGYQATRVIRSLDNKKLSNIPIIAMTANAFEEDRKNAFEAGMNEHVSKPINVSKLIEIINEVLRSNKK